MLAARLVGPGRLEVTEEPTPAVAAGEALVESQRASICGSDLHIVFDGFYRGDYPGPPGFPGHEGVGKVVESASGTFAPGTWVLAVPNPPAARCYAELQAVSERSLVALPEGGDPDRLLLAQQLGTVVHALKRHWPTDRCSAAGKTAAICGAGSAGLFFVQLARLAGFAQVIVADRSTLRLGIAERFGADVVVEAPGQSFVEAVLDHTAGAGADLVVEAAGYDETRLQCLEAVRQNGRVGYFGFPERPAGSSIWSYGEAWRKTPTIEVVNGTQNEPGLASFREAIELIDSGKVDVGPFLEPVYPLGQVQEAFQAARELRGGKVAVELAG